MWFRKRPVEQFRPIERLVLDSVRAGLPEELQIIFDDHLVGVNLVQRYDYREVNMYRMVKKTATFPAIKFATGKEEQVLAEVVLRVEGVSKTVRARVWVVNGNLFQLAFQGPMDKLDAPASVERVVVHPLG